MRNISQFDHAAEEGVILRVIKQVLTKARIGNRCAFACYESNFEGCKNVTGQTTASCASTSLRRGAPDNSECRWLRVLWSQFIKLTDIPYLLCTPYSGTFHTHIAMSSSIHQTLVMSLPRMLKTHNFLILLTRDSTD